MRSDQETACIVIIKYKRKYDKVGFWCSFIKLLAAGDAFSVWYNFELYQTIENMHIFSYLLAPLVKMIGLMEHDYPLGAYIMNKANGYPLSSFGPNG